MGIVYPAQDLVISWSHGRSTQLRTDQPWDEDADLVCERPDLFTDEPLKVYGRRPVPTSTVEDTSAAPGEKRQLPVTVKAVRAWAAEEGIDVPARGKLPDDLVEQYAQAQAEQGGPAADGGN